MISILIKNRWLLIIFAVFIFIRFFGLGQIYHQDEYRWATIVNPVFDESSGSHPPMNRIVLGLVGSVLGYDSLRVAPFIFSILNLWLIYLISLRLSGNKRTALLAAGLFTINIYSIISNLQIDIDGAILPFFILLGYFAYLHILDRQRKGFWFFIFSLSIIGGFLTKLSFLLFIGALIIDLGLRAYYLKLDLKKAFRKIWLWVA